MSKTAMFCVMGVLVVLALFLPDTAWAGSSAGNPQFDTSAGDAWLDYVKAGWKYASYIMLYLGLIIIGAAVVLSPNNSAIWYRWGLSLAVLGAFGESLTSYIYSLGGNTME